jgi:predicted ester cyclase
MSSRTRFVEWLFGTVWTQGETDAVDQEISELTFHYGDTRRRMDGAALREVIERWRTGFPDLRVDVEDVVEQDDRVALRARLRGTHLGPWRDLEATGRSIDMEVMMFLRWQDDRLVEVWELDDAPGRDRQLGLI